MKENDIKERLNEAIFIMGNSFGPSLTNLLLYGPFQKDFISEENLEILRYTEKLNQDHYVNQIFPKLKDIVNVLTCNNNEFPKSREEFNSFFRLRKPEQVRNKFRDSYRGQFGLDQLTAKALFSNESIGYMEDYVKYGLNKSSKYIFSFRFKKAPRIKEKYQINFKELKEWQREEFFKLLIEVAEGDFNFWEKYSEYYNRYDENVLKMMIGDLVGLKIVETNQKDAEKKLELLSRVGSNIQFKSFKLVSGDRYNDHRNRILEGRPGGIDYTVFDRGLVNFPLEIKYFDLQSGILDLFGPNAHGIYSIRGKKANKTYRRSN